MVQVNKELTASEYIGRYLRKELKRRGMTQEEFAKAAFCELRTISRWVNGQANLNTLETICQVWNVPMREVFSDEDLPHPVYVIFCRSKIKSRVV